jgi:hypothetical protein
MGPFQIPNTNALLSGKSPEASGPRFPRIIQTVTAQETPAAFQTVRLIVLAFSRS